MVGHSVRVYEGLGCSRRSLDVLMATLRKTLRGSKYTVETISPADILKGSWVYDTAMLAIGGGYDRGYQEALGRQGIALIRQYVQEGGAYLGICAGGYFACNYVEFDRGGPLEVCSYRDLKFFLGKCVGPAFPGFKYDSEHGAHAVNLLWIGTAHLRSDSRSTVSDLCNTSSAHRSLEYAHRCPDSALKNQDSADRRIDSAHKCPDSRYLTGTSNSQSDQGNLTCYLNGGGYFCASDTADTARFRSLALYRDLPGRPAAIIQCLSGRGTAILTGVHLEYVTSDLDRNDQRINAIYSQLLRADQIRQDIFAELLKLLGLDIVDADVQSKL